MRCTLPWKKPKIYKKAESVPKGQSWQSHSTHVLKSLQKKTSSLVSTGESQNCLVSSKRQTLTDSNTPGLCYRKYAFVII